MADNIDDFNTITGLIFAQLYANFPVKEDLDEAAIAKALGIEIIDVSSKDWPDPKIFNFGEISPGLPLRRVLWAACIWLRDEGFIRADGESANIEMVLTTKALSAMNAHPKSLEEPLGKRLQSAAKTAGTEAGKKAISETASLIIGAVAKSFLG
ncbi:hypothetical protein [Labrenzia sp. 011]|uniref:hypothetical protein n=1 Tax=Labrenzia sp. 011 TaxID=2171494 RepID=UPI000D5127AA|nr:hypothetical protein [Labrenzia sp. 011]PVB59733.1 hypothetical protein DCO57_20665 [Labrenzia sp. 011]